MVMENPTQFTMVRAVPLEFGGAFLATRVENKGESATTIHPQKIRNIISTSFEAVRNIKGESRQQSPEKKSASPAVFLVPIFSEINPPAIHAIPPIPMIKKESREIL